MTNMHTSAKELVIKAAELSGLLNEVATFLWFTSRQKLVGRCLPCELAAQLTEAFDDHICLPAICAENIYGEGREIGLDISPRGPDEAAEVAAFVG